MQHLPERIPQQSIPALQAPPPPGPEAAPAQGEDQLKPEGILSRLMGMLPNLYHEPTGISDLLRNINETFGFEGSGLIAFTGDRTSSQALHYLGSASAVQAPPLDRNYPWTRENLLNGNIVCFATPSGLPEAAAIDSAHFEAAGISCYLAIPIYVRDSVDYFFVAHHRRCGQVWRKETISLIRLIGEVFVFALQRAGEPGEVRQQSGLERLLAEVSGRLINVSPDEVDREVNAALKQVREVLGFDRFALLALSPDKREIMVTHSSHGEGTTPVTEKKDIGALFPWARKSLLRGEVVSFASPEELPPEASVDRRSWLASGVQSNVTIPVHVAGSLQYLLAGSRVRAGRSIEAGLLRGLRLFGELVANALVRCGSLAAQKNAQEEILRLEEKLQSESEQLHAGMIPSTRQAEIVGESAALARTLALTEQVAPTDSTVLITGETGTGKELVAQAIHKLGKRRTRSLVKVNCASLPAALVESELFGREKGAYTGALTRQAGRFELADGGTIFLDEIAEMSLELQAKLLRVLQEGEFERLGSARTIQVDVRVIAATNRNLADEVAKGNFREDLYYRLNVFQIEVPPLRERVEDIPLLVWSFVQEFSEKMGKKINRISRQDMATLQSYQWPGNVRELRNVVEHAVIVSAGEKLQVRLPANGHKETARHKTLEEYEIMHIRDALRLTNWRIKGEGGAARLLGLNPSTLYSRMQKHGISQHRERDDMPP